jgi:single-stranded-DNA-specific exonuclease
MHIFGQKYRWQIPDVDASQAHALASSYNLCVPVMRTLLARGYMDRALLDEFLFSSFEKDVAHPSLMKDADRAIDRLLYAIEHKEKILIFGDYDVDGITSSALMMHCLLPLGAQVNFFVPHRVKDGYGLSEKVVQRAAENGYKLIITVDNGITAFGPATLAKKLGVDLIITDHHQPHAHMPEAFAIINPHQAGCAYPFKSFAGVGVSFKLLSLLYERKQMPLPVKAYELLLLGTIADVVPLLGENRFWVRHGLQLVNQAQSLAMRVLKNNSTIQAARLTSLDIGFGMTPQINALGRLEDPRQGVKFLIGSDEQEVEQIGKVLYELNQARKEIEKNIYNGIVAEIESGAIDVAKERVIVASSSHWPPGVIGLVASRIVSAYARPTILLHVGADGMAKGSARSISEFNLFGALQKASHLLEKFGGHAHAAGMSLKAENIPAFKERLEEIAAQELTADDLLPKLKLDASLQVSEINQKFVDDLAYLQPFGAQNPQPLFHVPQVSLVQKPQLLKEAHVKGMVFADGVIKPVIFFNRPDLYEQLLERGTEPFDLAGQVTENHWNGRVNVELIGLDVSFSSGN